MEHLEKPRVEQSVIVLPRADHRHVAVERAQIEALRALLKLTQLKAEPS